MAENQEQGKPNEREIPVLTVLKNNCILKNIFLLDNPPSISPSSSSVNENDDKESETEELLVVGRHPDCNIKLEHPSISRFHLRIHSKPSSRSLFVTDLSSVHGTWISGKRIEPGVTMELNEGDTLHLGASSRLYRLHWVPLSRAYDVDNPFVPQLDDADPAEGEETERVIDQDENTLSCGNDQMLTMDDNVEGLEKLFPDEDRCTSMVKTSPMAPVTPEDICSPFCNEEEVEKDCSLGEYNQENGPFHLEKERSTPQACFPSEAYQSVSQQETTDVSGLNSEKKSGLSICSRRGKNESVKIETSRSRGSFEMINIPLFDENHMSELVLEDHYAHPDNNEQIFTPDKQETTEVSGLNSEKKSGLSIWSRRSGKDESVKIETSRSRGSCERINIPLFDENHVSELVLEDRYARPDNNEQIFTLDKENMYSEQIFTPNKQNTYNDQIFTPDKENMSPNSRLVKLLKSIGEEVSKSELISKTPISSADQDEVEIFTPDKENMTPNSHLLKSMKNIKKYRSSPLKRANNSNMYQEEAVLHTSDNREVLQERKSTNSAFKSCISLKKEAAFLNARADRDPFRPLPLNSTTISDANSKPSVHEDTMVNHLHNNTTKVEETSWIIVVDTACLLNKKSRKELQLLRGLRGTSLVIPRIVVRELDCMKRQGSFFTRTTEVSAALQWIQESMAVAKWWIHVQTSAEEGRLIPPTPPASPHWFSDEKGPFSVGSKPFSPYNLQEIVTPTAADHILECALLFRRTKNEGQLVLLSDDVALKIKAMAEGVVCETAEEFRRSLVNPFSSRFLYSNSSPIGPTWSCADDTVLKEKYYPSPSRKLSKSGEGVKGLKLILLHNSNFRHITPVS
ncbi:hypothetical protein CDL12_16507 [Handroanthus impetiginosus]|uniref:FHA domain-containing protein n=1 Tax=Handroanthus impetiginosus TaxID=429701 RepID=A0A2G9H093_9LAMI|nr:hypothetical protein CDL12_16507 [Handroanthus impetiginosus]